MDKNKLKKGIGIVVLLVVVIFIYYYFFLGPSLAFQKQEKLLQRGGKRYFEQNSYLLPEEGKVRDVFLTTLYDKKYVDTLYVPNSKKLCSSKDSFVKIKKEKGEYKYYTYLSCGKYHSTIDHEGPVITLNGKATITLARGSEYKEAGVKTVKDNQDGVMDNKEVDIDASKVDTTTAGTYTVTYTAYDSLHNKTVKKRTVRVVEKLSSTITNGTAKRGYYQGEEENNYIMFNAMLWRIVGFDQDGNITLVTDEALANVDYGIEKNKTVKESAIAKWLNEYFYGLLTSDAKKMIVKNSKWCSDTLSKDELGTTTCKETTKMTVGLLSVQDFNKSLQDGYTYLNNKIVTWMMNPGKTTATAWTNRNDYNYLVGANYIEDKAEIVFGVRPSIRIQKDAEIVGGTGSSTDPYLLGDYTKGDVQDFLNTRLTGEYVNYSGYLFRIVDTQGDGTTHVMLDGVLGKDDQYPQISYGDGNKINIYNPSKKGNIGYRIVNEMTEYIQTNYFVKKEITVPIYKYRAQYGKEESSKKYTVKLAAPNTFDLFSARRENSSIEGYWFINSSKTEGMKYVVGRNGTVYETGMDTIASAGVKVSAYFDKNVKITGGSGTLLDPYKIKK